MRKLTSLGFLVTALLILSGCSQSPSQLFPEKFLIDRDLFKNSIQKFDQSSKISNSVEQDGLSKAEQVISLTEESIESAKKVSDDFLEYLHPELKENYKEKFIKGNELYYEGLKLSRPDDGIESESVKKQVEGNNLIQAWIDWWSNDANAQPIVDKLFI